MSAQQSATPEDKKPPVGNLLNTLETSSVRLGVKRGMIFKLLKEKKIAAVKLGNRTMIPEAELLRFVASLEPRG